MKTSLFVIVFFMLTVFFNPVTGFSQCSTTVFSENFNIAGNTNSNLNNSTLPAGETKGDYAASCGGTVSVTNNADCCGGGSNKWKSNSTQNPGWGPTGNDGGSVTDFALMIDGSCGVANGTVWCTNITVAAGEIYDFSAAYSSPWLNSGTTHNPGIWLSINGVQISPTAIVVDQTTTSTTTANYTPYNLQACTYAIPAGTSGSVPFCIGMAQTCDNVTWATCANGSGNDFLVDDILIKKCSGGTASACTYTGSVLPVELLNFSGRIEANKVTLNWTTASERSSVYFSVEKSEDGQNFYEIGSVAAQGNSSNQVNYQYSDNHFNVTSYYRLKMVDIDGTYKYSRIIVLENNNEKVRVIHLGEGKLEIKAVAKEDTEWKLSIYSLLGQEFINEIISIKKGENSIVKEIKGGESAKILRITTLDGSVILSDVIVW